MKISRVIISEVDFKKLMKKSGLTLVDLERKSGVSRQAIWNAVNGKCVMKQKTWDRIKPFLITKSGD